MAYEGKHLFDFINVMVGEQLQIYFIILSQRLQMEQYTSITWLETGSKQRL